jgi:hypothetical protein
MKIKPKYATLFLHFKQGDDFATHLEEQGAISKAFEGDVSPDFCHVS